MQRYAHTVGISGSNILIFNHFSQCAVTASAPKRPQERYVIIWCLRSTMSQRIIDVSLLRKVPVDISQSSMKSLVKAKVIWSLRKLLLLNETGFRRSVVRSFAHPAVTPMYVRPCSFSVSVSFPFFSLRFHQASRVESVPSSTSIC